MYFSNSSLRHALPIEILINNRLLLIVFFNMLSGSFVRPLGP